MWKLSVDWQDQPCGCGAGIEELFALGGECVSLYLSTHETLVDKETSHLPLYLYISRDGKQNLASRCKKDIMSQIKTRSTGGRCTLLDPVSAG